MDKRLNESPALKYEDAVHKLEVSRSALARALLSPPADANNQASNGGGTKPHASAAGSMLKDTLSSWWRHHPWQAPLQEIHHLIDDSVGAGTRRYPYAALISAATIGSALVLAKPWRWFPAGRWAALSLLKPTATTASSLLKDVPVSALMSLLVAAAMKPSPTAMAKKRPAEKREMPL
jgi:hypothetical protein